MERDKSLLDVVGCRVADGEDQHRIGELSVHPDVLVKRQEPDLGPNPSHDGPADR